MRGTFNFQGTVKNIWQLLNSKLFHNWKLGNIQIHMSINLCCVYNYILMQWYTLQVTASIIMVEANQVQKGIVDLVNKHGIRKLVMGDVPEK